MIPVAANDVAFSAHAVLLTAITLFQIVIYEVSTIFIHCSFALLIEFLSTLNVVTSPCSAEVRKSRKFLLELSL